MFSYLRNTNLHFLNFRGRCLTEISDFTAVLSSANFNLNFPILNALVFDRKSPKNAPVENIVTLCFCTAFSQSQCACFVQGIYPVAQQFLSQKSLVISRSGGGGGGGEPWGGGGVLVVPFRS